MKTENVWEKYYGKQAMVNNARNIMPMVKWEMIADAPNDPPSMRELWKTAYSIARSERRSTFEMCPWRKLI